MKTDRHFEIQDGGRQDTFRRGTDPQKFCKLLIWPCTKFHAFIIKCTIFSHIRPTIMGAQWVSGRLFEPRLRAAAGSNLTGVTVLCP